MPDVRELVLLTEKVTARTDMATQALRTLARLLHVTNAVPEEIVARFVALADEIEALAQETKALIWAEEERTRTEDLANPDA